MPAHLHLALDPFDEGYIEETEPGIEPEAYRVPWPTIELEAEPPTLVGYPAPPMPGCRRRCRS
jgi:hypothetical protein